jgi:hypothetical protein
MSLSPETLELVSRGLGKLRPFVPSASTGYVFDGEEYTNYPTLAAYCKAKLREREFCYDTSYLAHGEGRSRAAVHEPFRDANGFTGGEEFSANGETDDLALILAFSQAVAKGALP